MEDRLLKEVFNMKRWEEAIESCVAKGMDKGELRKFCVPEVRLKLYEMIRDNKLEFSPGHQAAIPKDEPGEFRIVYVGETVERLLCSIVNNCLFDLLPEMVHKSCKSYQKGIGCGKVVKEASARLMKIDGDVVGGKYDFHHFFDTVNRESIMALFDKVEARLGFDKGTEPVINLLRRTWNSDLLFDLDGNLVEHYSGIRQGNACGSWLADAILYELDEFMSNKYEYYVRYSDDLIVIHDDVDEVTADINSIIKKYGVSLNPKKIETLRKDKWFKFLGFSIRGDKISLSSGRLKTFQREIQRRSVKAYKDSPQKILHSVNNYLYKGDKDGHSWATNVLPVINSEHDINELNKFVLDCLRAGITKKGKTGGLGYVPTQEDGVISRGTGKNVKANRQRVPGKIAGFMTLNCARNALLSSHDAYDALVRMI